MEIDHDLCKTDMYKYMQKGADYDPIDPAFYERKSGRCGYYIAETIGALFKNALPLSIPPPKILDIAAGTGIVSRRLDKMGYRVVATDLSGRMLEYLRKHNPEIQTEVGDMNDRLPFHEPSFDGAVTNWANRFINGSKITFEVRRLLKPGGVLIWPFSPDESAIWKELAGEWQITQAREYQQVLENIGFSVELVEKPIPREFDNGTIIYPSQFLIATKK